MLKPATVPFMQWAGHELSRVRDRRASTSGVIDGLVADERTEAVPVLETDVMMADADGRRRLAEEALRFALASNVGREPPPGSVRARYGNVAILPVKSLDDAKQRLDADIDAGPRRALAEAMFADVLVALRRARARCERILVVTSDSALSGSRPATARSCSRTRRRGPQPGGGEGDARARCEHGAERALLVPGDCPLLDPDELDEPDRAAGERPLGADRARPPRHRHERAAAHAAGFARAIVRTGQLRAPCRERAAAGTPPRSSRVPTLALDIDTPEDLEALQSTRWRAARRRRAHARDAATSCCAAGA